MIFSQGRHMNNDFHAYFKTGIVHFMAFPEIVSDSAKTEPTVMQIAVDDYFEVIEMTLIEEDEIRKKVKSILECASMEVVFGAQPVLLRQNLNINDENDTVREKSVSVLKQCIDQAYEIGATGLSFLSGKFNKERLEHAFELLVESTEEICKYAREKGNMMIELEVFDHEIDKKSLIGPVELAEKFGKRIREKYDNFGLLIDLSHLPLLKEKPSETIPRLKDFLTHIHIGNCLLSDRNSPVYGDYHPRFGYPGSENDVAELTEFLQVLVNTGFFNKKTRPIVSFEIKPAPGEHSEIIIANAKRTLNRAWLGVK